MYEEMVKKDRINWGKLFLIGFGFFGVSVLWSLYNTYVPMILDGKFGLDSVKIGLIMVMDNVAAFLIQPSIGVWSDSVRTKIGRRLPFIIIGAPLSAVAFGLIPLAQSLPVFMACTVSTLLAMAFWRTPVVALMPDVTPSKFRSQANGVINFMGGLGLVLGTSVGASLHKINSVYPFWFGSALVILAAVLVFIFVREPQQYEEKEDEHKFNTWQGLKEIFTKKQRDAILIFLAIFFWFIAYNAIETFLSLYGKNFLLLSEDMAGKLITSVGFAFLLFAIPSGLIGGKFGRRKTIMTGIVIMILTMAAMFFIPKDILLVEYFKLPILGEFRNLSFILLAAGIGWSLININSLPMVVDLTTKEHVGTYTGMYYFFSTLSAIIGPVLNGLIVKQSGGNYGQIMVVGPIFMAFALLCMILVKRGEANPDADKRHGSDSQSLVDELEGIDAIL